MNSIIYKIYEIKRVFDFEEIWEAVQYILEEGLYDYEELAEAIKQDKNLIQQLELELEKRHLLKKIPIKQKEILSAF